MRRLALLALLAAGTVLLVSACGPGSEVLPTAQTVEGKLPTKQVLKGDPAAGKGVYDSAGCGGCHTYTPAGSKGAVGPDLDKLAADAEKAAQGTLEEYTLAAIVNPEAYVPPGFAKGVMPAYGAQLKDQQIADLVAFLTQQP